MSAQKLVRMANQIGAFFVTQKGDPVPAIAAHIREFWEPRMRQAILAHVDAGGAGLDAPVRAAVEKLR